MVMTRRILFACAECESALVWPVNAEPLTDPVLLAEDSFAECRDADGQPVVQVHSASRWQARLEPSGVVTCPQGHTVGIRAGNGRPSPDRLNFLKDRVVTREMRGRV
jgi:hypothetical protein